MSTNVPAVPPSPEPEPEPEAPAVAQGGPVVEAAGDAASGDPAPSPDVEAKVELSEGLALTANEANAMAASAGVRIVMPLGPVKVGKTTMAVEIYGQYLKRMRWAEASFCWSRSLLDFELLAFPSRLNAGADLPETWRTRLTEVRYLLHMQLRRSDGARPNLLIANQSGELSKRVRDGEDPATELPLLSHAERILICVDGARVADPALCGRAVGDTRQLIGTLSERAELLPEARAAIVLTKLDKVVAGGGLERWAQAEGDLTKRLTALGRGAASFRIAARSATETPDNQFEDLARWLLADSPGAPTAPLSPHDASRSLGHYEGAA